MSPAAAYDDDLRLAHVLVDDADAITMDRFRAGDLAVSTKPDDTPVTDADQRVEEVMRATLARVRPRDAVQGEEQGRTGSGSRCWVLDPIDGTKSYLRGVPVWATLLALMVDDEVVAGVVSAPALGRRWWAARGGGAWVGRSLAKARRCTVSSIGTLGDASLSHASLDAWQRLDRLDSFLALTRRCWRTRGYGDFWSYVLLAEGAVDIAAEPELKLHDMAAPALVVTEAGGAFTDLDGVPGPLGTGAVATNGLLHDAVLAQLSGPG